MEKTPNNNIQSTDWEYTDDKLEIAADSSAEQKESKRLFSKNALRTFGAIALTATLALGMAGCGNKEAESANTPSDTIVTEEQNNQGMVDPELDATDDDSDSSEQATSYEEAVGLENTTPLTQDDIFEQFGGDDMYETMRQNMPEMLTYIDEWMASNGFFNIRTSQIDNKTGIISKAYMHVDKFDRDCFVVVQFTEYENGTFDLDVRKSENGSRIYAQQDEEELPTTATINDYIENLDIEW